MRAASVFLVIGALTGTDTPGEIRFPATARIL